MHHQASYSHFSHLLGFSHTLNGQKCADTWILRPYVVAGHLISKSGAASTPLGKLSERFWNLGCRDLLPFSHVSISEVMRWWRMKVWLTSGVPVHPKSLWFVLRWGLSMQASQIIPHQSQKAISLRVSFCALGQCSVETVATNLEALCCWKPETRPHKYTQVSGHTTVLCNSQTHKDKISKGKISHFYSPLTLLFQPLWISTCQKPKV